MRKTNSHKYDTSELLFFFFLQELILFDSTSIIDTVPELTDSDTAGGQSELSLSIYLFFWTKNNPRNSSLSFYQLQPPQSLFLLNVAESLLALTFIYPAL